MPTYTYRCDGCGHEFEEIQSFHASPTMKCPVCGKMLAKRIIGPCAGIIFKGTGFYETDYKKKASEKSPS